MTKLTEITFIEIATTGNGTTIHGDSRVPAEKYEEWLAESPGLQAALELLVLPTDHHFFEQTFELDFETGHQLCVAADTITPDDEVLFAVYKETGSTVRVVTGITPEPTKNFTVQLHRVSSASFSSENTVSSMAKPGEPGYWTIVGAHEGTAMNGLPSRHHLVEEDLGGDLAFWCSNAIVHSDEFGVPFTSTWRKVIGVSEESDTGTNEGDTGSDDDNDGLVNELTE